MPEAPELMTEREYVAVQTALDRAAGIEHAGSLSRQGDSAAAHLKHVRDAVMHQRPIHIDNWHEYRGFIPGLARYSFNGNLAVFDSSKGTPMDRAQRYREAVASSEAIEAKLTRKRLEAH